MSMWNVWNLKIWKLQCLNLNVGILKVENWNLKSLCKMFKKNLNIWKLKIKNWKVWILKTEKFEYWKLKTKMFEYWKLKTKMSKY